MNALRLFFTSALLASRAFGAEAAHDSMDANHCEAYIDKAASVEFSEGSGLGLAIFVKVDLNAVHGPVSAVGYLNRRVDSADSSDNWETSRLKAIAPDYFMYTQSTRAPHGPNFPNPDRTGVFFVEAEAGTRYWVHSSDEEHSRNFFTDENLRANLDTSLGRWFISPQFTLIHLDLLPETAGRVGYLNPQNCQ